MITEKINDSLGKYIKISGDDVERKSDIILNRHIIGSVLPMQINWVNGRKEYIFETTGYTSLEDYMDEHKPDDAGILKLLEGLRKAALELEEYFLGADHMVIAGSFSYGDHGEYDETHGGHGQNIGAYIQTAQIHCSTGCHMV